MENFWLIVVAFAVLSYIFGSFSPSYVISGKSLEGWGKSSWGAMSTFEKTGKKWKGALVIALDVLKGFIPVATFTSLVAPVGYDRLIVLAVSSFCVVLGHNYSVNLKFRGGRGLSSGWGILLAVNWILALICFGTLVFWIFIVQIWMNGRLQKGIQGLFRDNLLGRIVGIVCCLIPIYFLAGQERFYALLPMMVLIICWHWQRVRDFIAENKETLRKCFGIRGSR